MILFLLTHWIHSSSDYAFPDETVLSMRADVDLTEENKYIQTLHCVLPIREDVTPSISDAARLLEISYKVHVKVQLQEGSYQTLTGDTHGFMSVEIPILIGTVPLTINNKIVSPRNRLTSRTATNDSKKSDGSKDNDTTSSANSGGLPKKLSASDDGLKGRKTSKHESLPSVEKKTKSFWRNVPLPRIKAKQPKDCPVSPIFTGSPTTYSDHNDPFDDELYQQLSDVSSAKNTDPSYPPSSSNNGSHTSQSAPSPRTEIDLLPSHLQKLFEPNDTQQLCAKPSLLEMKPDEKDDETSTSGPRSKTANVLDVPRSDSNQRQSRSSSIDNSNPPPDQATQRRPSTVTAPPPTSDRTAHVRVVNIFMSSDEEDEEEPQQQEETDNPILHNTAGTLESNRRSHHRHLRRNTQEDSDSDDDSPLTLLSRQPRNR